ncbi:MAG: hypothetical protein V3W24_04850 [Gemmatimonadota bacterium]
MTRTKLTALAVLPGAAVLFAACSGSDWEAVSYELGDTTVVRTVSGSAWGGPARLVERARIDLEAADSANTIRMVAALAVGPRGDVYVVDPETPAVRSYDEDGEYRRSFKVPPDSAGAYELPNGVAVLADGRVVIRDPRTASFLIYSSRGNYLERWPHPFRVYSPLPVMLDHEERLYTATPFNPSAPREERRQGLVRYAPDGTIEDTIPIPEIDYAPPALSVVSYEGDTVSFRIPLYPRTFWAWSPTGDWVRGISSGYSFDVARPDGRVVRIEREHEPVAASREERMALYRSVDRRARQLDYRWTWRGPVVPETKPPYKSIFTDRDGRIWVQLHQPAQLRAGEAGEEAPVPTEPEPDSASAASAAGEDSASVASSIRENIDRPSARDFGEPIVFDVFQPDGRYLGQVSAPAGFRTRPMPVIQGNTVWAAVGERGSVPSIVRFEIER